MQRMRHLTELSADLAIRPLQALLLLVSFVGVLWVPPAQVLFTFDGRSFTIPGYWSGAGSPMPSAGRGWGDAAAAR